LLDSEFREVGLGAEGRGEGGRDLISAVKADELPEELKREQEAVDDAVGMEGVEKQHV